MGKAQKRKAGLMRRAMVAPPAGRKAAILARFGAVALAALLSGCGIFTQASGPVATRLVLASKPADGETATAMISQYRRAHGLSPVSSDAALTEVVADRFPPNTGTLCDHSESIATVTPLNLGSTTSFMYAWVP